MVRTCDGDPWGVHLSSRLRGRPVSRWRRGCSGAGRTLHARNTTRPFPGTRWRTACARRAWRWATSTTSRSTTNPCEGSSACWRPMSPSPQADCVRSSTPCRCGCGKSSTPRGSWIGGSGTVLTSATFICRTTSPTQPAHSSPLPSTTRPSIRRPDRSPAGLAARTPLHDRRASKQLAHQASQKRTGLVAETLAFMRENKKWWLIPILVVLLLLGVLLVVGGSSAAPFIYTLF